MNVLKDIGLVYNTNSLKPLQIEQLGEILPDQDFIRVLEFGAGKSSTLIFNSLKKKYKNIKYVTYETNAKYAPKTEGIEVRMHTRKELTLSTISIPSNEKYDLVIVDGPDGQDRKYWYSLFVDNVESGTIIHIDDAFHFASFEHEFLKSFPNAEILYEQGRENLHSDGSYTGNKNCWITSKL